MTFAGHAGIPVTECRPRAVYRLRSRNLALGVYDGKGGFVGIREKLGSRYLFTEVHRDRGGTVTPLEEVGSVPDSVPLEEYLGSVDGETRRPVAFDEPIRLGGRGWYFTDTGEASEEIKAFAVGNRELFELLEGMSS